MSGSLSCFVMTLYTNQPNRGLCQCGKESAVQRYA